MDRDDDSFPDYYALLGIAEKATQDEIRQAYKSKALLNHPDRIPPTPGNPREEETRRREATRRFQDIADAYYILSDPTRRAQYDEERLERLRSGRGTADTGASGGANFFKKFFGGTGAPSYDFDGQHASSSSSGHRQQQESDGRQGGRPNADNMFSSVFEDLLRPEVEKPGKLFSLLGAASGAGLGFICGSFVGASVGFYGGWKLGQIRDAKGRSVYDVFKSLDRTKRYEILRELVRKAMSGEIPGLSGFPKAGSSK